MKTIFDLILRSVLRLPRPLKKAIALIVDAASCAGSVYAAFYLRLDQLVPFFGDGFFQPELAFFIALFISLPLFYFGGFYNVIFRYSERFAAKAVLKAFSGYFLIYVIVVSVVGLPGVPRTIGIIQPLVFLILVGLSRTTARYFLGDGYKSKNRRDAKSRVLIYGAGSSGRQLAGTLARSYEMQVVGFLDDNSELHGHLINGFFVYKPSEMRDIVLGHSVTDILLALPKIDRKRRNQILDRMRGCQISVRTLPSVTELAQGKIDISSLKELEIDDLLGRDTVLPDETLFKQNVSGKIVLVTGAGGSIGSELCRQIHKLNPAQLLLIDSSEFALYLIHQELIDISGNSRLEIVPLIASVCDTARMRDIISAYRPHTIYHAAAYKHVPMVEHNPLEGVKNNVFGTLNTALAALEAAVQHFVLVSTDKAVRPTNVMGASKRVAEMVLQALAGTNPITQFSMVRFGNVLGSSGSVVPRFREQIRNGGPITLTHAEVTRFFMTIPEAAELVIQAGAMAEGGDVFVLDMGSPVKIMDLAVRMVELSGLSIKSPENPFGDIEIEISGLRPGEKLYEELLIGERPIRTKHPKIIRANEDYIDWADLKPKLEVLMATIESRDVVGLVDQIKALVPGYLPSGAIVDWVWLARDISLSRIPN